MEESDGIGGGYQVTPCVGVWIEIGSTERQRRNREVTPCVGVWIEILVTEKWWCREGVTPCVGVWIEIKNLMSLGIEQKSLPAWECGLK